MIVKSILYTIKGFDFRSYLEKLVKRDASRIALQFTHTAFFTHLLIAFYVFSKSATRFQQKRDVFDASWCNWFINFSRYDHLYRYLAMVEIQNALTSETLANADKMEDTKMYEWRKCQAQPDGTVQNGWLLKKDLSFLPASEVSIHISFLFDNWKSIL